MEKRMTAVDAREMANNWQENKCSKYVDKALEQIAERAGKGFYSAEVPIPSPDNVNYNECVKAMKELGYTLDYQGSYYTRWAW